MKWLFFLLLTCASSWTTKSAKILFIGTMPSRSHFTLSFRLAKELADRGHQVTSINPFPQKNPIKNYKDVSIEEVSEFVEGLRQSVFGKYGMEAEMSVGFVLEMGLNITEMALKNTNVQKLLNSGETFDVVVMEHFLNEAFMGFAHVFKAPLVLLSSTGTNSMNNHLFANPAPASYVPNLSGSFTKRMNFWQRLQNFIFNQFIDIYRELFYLPRQKELFLKYIKSDLEFEDVLYNSSLMLTNSHVSVNDAVPHVPGIIEIGGYHLSAPKQIPEDLQKFLDGATEGVVLFSMGSNLKSKDLKPEVRAAILNAFSKIKQRVLWKFEENLPDAPENVKIMKWVPQQDVLAHPNVKAFISHGGLLSTIETVYNGVPIIGIPVFGDQMSNVAAAVNNGYAVSVPLKEISEEKLSWALDEILNNPKYRENVQRRSSLMKDRPLKPIDSAVYWIEHVIRQRGAPHLRSAGLDLRWYQREMVDVIFFLLLVVITISVVIYSTVSVIVKWLCRNEARKRKVKKN